MNIDPIQVHLALNHYPIFALVIGAVILLISILLKSKILIKASMLLITTVGLACIPVFYSGEESEERVEHMEGVSEHFLEEHEELGEASFQAALILSGFALLLFFIEHFTRRNIPIANWLLVLASFIVLGLFIVTASHGGKIRHSELRGIVVVDRPMDHGDD